ncbi:MAG TPA: hypothetical protein VND65_04530 [Candidatus Binatia bacterium]|nr:hypothetical protein [Candidatus Binatia bacterium]
MPWTFALRRSGRMAAVFFFLTACLAAQETAPAGDPAVRELGEQVRELRTIVEQMRVENEQSRAEMRQLRQELQETRRMLTPGAAEDRARAALSANAESSAAPAQNVPAGTPVDLASRVQKLEESTQMLGSKVDEQYQTKVETASKYRVRLSGIALMNLFHNVGASDNMDLPSYAEPVQMGTNQANFGATLRQTEIGLEVFGPTLAGAKSSANVVFDFAGGFPNANNGVNFGLVRMQTASARLDWKQTSLIAGQDSLFISPLSPTSFASLAIPAFGNAGNLWGWIPQVRLEHRFQLSDQQTVTVQGGILDNLDWEQPATQYFRMAQAGEQSGQPAYAVRTSWSRPMYGHPLGLGVAGYYGRQNWGWDRYVDAWAAMADWQIPLAPRLSLSGEFYRGRGVAGLGAAIGQNILWGGNPLNPFTPIRGVDSAGGWSQLKLQLTHKLEVNGTFAQDDVFSSDVLGFTNDADNFGSPIFSRNRGALGNFVYRPRSDLLLSAEFRRFHTLTFFDGGNKTNQVNLAMGVLF